MFRRDPLTYLLATATCFVVMSGCTGGRGPDYSVLELAEVNGVVKLDGQPLEGAKVVFREANHRPPRQSYATTVADGSYRLKYDKGVFGCLPGEMVVRITLDRRGEGDDGPAQDSKIPARYNSKSELNRTVEPNGDHTFDFELTSS